MPRRRQRPRLHTRPPRKLSIRLGAPNYDARVPEELSLLSHDDDPLCEFLDAPLTAIRMPLHELGSTAVDALLEQIAGGPPRDVESPIAPELVLRGSTAAAPG